MRDIKQDVRMQVLDFRMTQLEYLVRPTALGAIGGMFATASLFLGEAKLALTCERIATGFFTAEALAQGKYWLAFANGAGAMATRVHHSIYRDSYKLTQKNDIVGAGAMFVRDLRNINEYASRGQNYKSAPYDVVNTEDHFVSRVGYPIKNLPGSELVNNAFLNVEYGDPSYAKYSKLQQDGYMPEHQAICAQTHFDIKDSEGNIQTYKLFAKAGIAEGAAPHTGQFGLGSLQIPGQMSQPGVSFYVTRETDDPDSIPFYKLSDSSPDDAILEKKAILIMSGVKREKVRDLSEVNLNLKYPYSIDNYQNMLYDKTHGMPFRTIDKSYHAFSPFTARDFINSFSHKEYFENWRYSIPNRTCQSFAKAAFENITQATPSEFLPYPMHWSHEGQYSELTTSQMDDILRSTYKGIVFGNIEQNTFFRNFVHK
jgi:hypothetical protein